MCTRCIYLTDTPFSQDVVTNCQDMRAGHGRTLVFTKNVAAANAAYKVLYDQGVDVMLYHREVPAEGRAKALAIMGRCVSSKPES